MGTESHAEPGQVAVTPSALATKSILLIDDDLELGQAMREYFGRRQIELEAIHDARRGLSRALTGCHDLVLLDVMMPGLDGLELLRVLRKASQVPVIMLTAKTRQMDRVAGLDAGADDYLPKPFGPEELLARIRAVLRRTSQALEAAEPVELGGLTLIPGAREVRSEGIAIALTSIEYDVFEILIRSAGRTVTRESLTSAIYRRQVSPFDRAVDMHVSNLRKKLGSKGALIRTVRGSGYFFATEPELRDP
jgi:two-component system response regulator CpxR